MLPFEPLSVTVVVKSVSTVVPVVADEGFGDGAGVGLGVGLGRRKGQDTMLVSKVRTYKVMYNG